MKKFYAAVVIACFALIPATGAYSSELTLDKEKGLKDLLDVQIQLNSEQPMVVEQKEMDDLLLESEEGIVKTKNSARIGDYGKGLTAYNNNDFATALREWTPLAEQGHTYSQYGLGLMYANAYGVRKNYKTALKWFRPAADQGNASAQYQIGLYYQFVGSTDPESMANALKTAMKWYKLAAEQGNVSAQLMLGEIFSEEEEGVFDAVYALMWFSIVAKSGDEYAVEVRERMLGIMRPAEIAEAQKLARECVRKKYKGC
jgi:hypothetical protein